MNSPNNYVAGEDIYLEDIISEELNSLNSQFVDKSKFNEMCNKAVNKLFPDNVRLSKNSKIKKMFLESYTANGYISKTMDMSKGKRLWSIVGENTNYNSEFLQRLSAEAEKRGYAVELYLLPLNPTKLQHMYIPEINLFIVSSESCPVDGFEEVFDIHSIIDTNNLKNHISEIENNLHLREILIENAFKKLSGTKKYHELLEFFYINNMDFNGVDKCFNRILERYT